MSTTHERDCTQPGTETWCWRTLLLAGIALLPIGAGHGQVSLGVDRVITVAEGAELSNCQGLRDVLASLTDASRSSPYVVRLGPYTYSCGSTALTVNPGITLEGSGPKLTSIRGTVDNARVGVVHLRDSTELRSLAIRNHTSSPAFGKIGVSIWDDSAVLSEVRLSGGSGGIALYAESASIQIERSEVREAMYLVDTSPIVLYSVFVSVGSHVLVNSQLHCIACFDRTTGGQLNVDCTL